MQKLIEFFWDPTSTYSYLAATQIEQVAKDHGARVQWRPFLLGKVFEATGNKAPVMVPAKGRYLFKDASLWAKHYGVPFSMPSKFPINSVLACRAVLAAAETGADVALSLAILDAYWVKNQDISDGEVIRQIADDIGLDGAQILVETQNPAVKEALKVNTESAIARGAFGAPTFYVDQQMFFGNDRLQLLAAYLKGEIA